MTTQARNDAARPADQPSAQPIEQITVRLRIGEDRMAACDDPVFLRLAGPGGRDFRLELARGKSFRRGHEDVFVLGAPDDPKTSVSHPELNDPTSPALNLHGINRVLIIKGMEPIPNVRGLGEMDDRLQVALVEIALQPAGGGEPIRYRREGPHWLGLICGLALELAPVGSSE